MMEAVKRSKELTMDEKAQLKLWASATPAQRLTWLEEAQKLAMHSGALLSKQALSHVDISSVVEVTNVSTHGFWLLWNGTEYFLAFEHFPWFKEASISAINHIELQGQEHVYWPDLDIDLSLAIIQNPEEFPLQARVGDKRTLTP